MRVRIDGTKTFLYTKGEMVEPLLTNSQLIIATDPAKGNMACVIGDVGGKILKILEFSGNDSRYYTKAMDTTEYCEDFQAYMRGYLKSCHIYQIGQEAPVVYDYKNTAGGMQHYKSQMVLTEIRARLIEVAKELNGETPELINNFAWKGAILPDGYRGHKEKGSHRYLSKVNPAYARFTDDVTDAICMYLYLVAKFRDREDMQADRAEEFKFNTSVKIIRAENVTKDMRTFKYSNYMSIQENAAYISNRLPGEAVCKLPLQGISIEDIYRFAEDLYPQSELYLYIKRGD